MAPNAFQISDIPPTIQRCRGTATVDEESGVDMDDRVSVKVSRSTIEKYNALGSAANRFEMVPRALGVMDRRRLIGDHRAVAYAT